MKLKRYRLLRTLIAAVVFGLCCAGALYADRFHLFYNIQFGPAFMKSVFRYAPGAVAAAVSILLITFLIGRVYCSFVCPLGILQDILMIFRRKFSRQPGYYGVRWGVFATVVVLAVCGLSLPLILLMPGSTFALLFTNIFRAGAESFGEERTIQPSMAAFAVSWGFFLMLIVLTAWRGRIYCNTLCPVGAILSLTASRPVFRIHFTESCVGCGACEKVCKAGCLDPKTKKVQNSNCVMCLNCLDVCKFKGLEYGRGPAEKFSPDRRVFLKAGLCSVGAVAVAPVVKNSLNTGKDSFGNPPAMPPGAGDFESFSRRCIACGLCVSACRGKVLAHASSQYGLSGVMLPYMRFSHGECNFNCNNCMSVCPAGALEKRPLDLKRRTAVGISVFTKERCIAYCNEEDCGACSEHCPVGAIEMVPYKKTTIPKVNGDLCIGCGACQHICPAYPAPAVQVHGFKKQVLRMAPERTESQKLKAEEEFPF